MRKIKINEVRSKIAEIDKLGISGQGEITLIKNVGHTGLAINGLQWELCTADAGQITKEFNRRYRITEDGHVKEICFVATCPACGEQFYLQEEPEEGSILWREWRPEGQTSYLEEEFGHEC